MASHPAQFRRLYRDLALECSPGCQADRGLVELQPACPLVDARAPEVAPRLRLALQPGSSLRAEVGLRLRRVWLCLFQTVRRLWVVPVALVSLSSAWLLHLAASVSLRVEHDPASLLDREKLVERQAQPELMDSHQLLPADSLPHAQRRQLAAARSWDSPS